MNGKNISYIAAATTAAFMPVYVSAKETVTVASTNTSFPVGITQDVADTGRALPVRSDGETRAIAGASLAAGDCLMAAAGGLIPWVGTTLTSTFVLGTCIGAASGELAIVTGTVIKVALNIAPRYGTV